MFTQTYANSDGSISISSTYRDDIDTGISSIVYSQFEVRNNHTRSYRYQNGGLDGVLEATF